jgi:histidine kinase
MTGTGEKERRGPGRARWWAIVLGVAVLLGLLDWLKARDSVAPTFRWPFAWFMIRELAWVPVAGVLSWLVRRVVAARARPAVLAGVLVAGFLGVTTYTSLVQASMSRVMGPPGYRKIGFWRMWGLGLRAVDQGIIYLGIVGIFGTIELRRRLREEAITAARLEAELTRAELDQMRVQLHPQLIEDTLRTTTEFVRSGASTQAVQLLARLSDVLRLTLATLGQERVSLRQETEFLQAYLALQQIRAPGRLRSRVDIPPEALTAEVPSLSLFQLAELPVSPWEGALELSAAVANGRLNVRLRQLAPARPGAEVTEAADRLDRLRQRLEHLYPKEHALRVEHENAGLLCTLDIPLVHLESLEMFPGDLRVVAR